MTKTESEAMMKGAKDADAEKNRTLLPQTTGVAL